ncbi:Hypothetical predicted protein [Lecanosticta acicola]|uniref:Uncharacterized protein n=1 Tax=Lecanosticta acicola TaxID=111012 RepID=A0AAI8YP50_9PEZI|nr:Hypothetical predicted protein [Lecanosticta acicola]
MVRNAVIVLAIVTGAGFLVLCGFALTRFYVFNAPARDDLVSARQEFSQAQYMREVRLRNQGIIAGGLGRGRPHLARANSAAEVGDAGKLDRIRSGEMWFDEFDPVPIPGARVTSNANGGSGTIRAARDLSSVNRAFSEGTPESGRRQLKIRVAVCSGDRCVTTTEIVKLALSRTG